MRIRTLFTTAAIGLAAAISAHGVTGAAAGPMPDRQVLHGVATAHQAPRIEVEFHSPGAAAADSVTGGGSGTASTENIVVTHGTTTYRIKRIDVTGTSLTKADLTALFDAANPEPAEARLKKLNAKAVVVPEILIDDATPGSERHVTIKNVQLSDVVAGKVGAGSAGPTSFAVKTGDDQVDGTVDTMQASSFDLPQIVRVFGTNRSDDAEPILPLYDVVSATGFKIANTKKDTLITIAAIKETGLKGRPFKSDILSKPRTGPLTKDEQTAILDEVNHSFEIGGIEMTDLGVRVAAGEGPVKVDLASLSMHDYGQGKVGGMTMRAFKLDAPTAKIGIGSIEGGPFILPRPNNPDPALASNPVMPTNGKLEMNQFDVDVTSQGKDATPNRVRFSVRHTGMAGEGDPGELPRSAKLAMDNIVFDLPPDPSSPSQPLIDMGYRHVDLSVGLASTYDSAAQALSIRDLTLNGADMGSVGLGVDLVNVTKGLISPNQEVVKASALALLAKAISLDVVNGGLADKALAWKAKQDGLTVDQERAFLIDYFGTKLPAAMGDNANAKAIGGAIAKFVAAPKTLHIAIASQGGLGVGSMALLSDPGLLLDTLTVKATANQPAQTPPPQQ